MVDGSISITSSQSMRGPGLLGCSLAALNAKLVTAPPRMVMLDSPTADAVLNPAAGVTQGRAGSCTLLAKSPQPQQSAWLADQEGQLCAL